MKDNKHITAFKKSHLRSGESIKAFGQGYIGNAMGSGKDKQYNGVLIITESKVTFYRKGFIGEVIQNIPLKSITSIERKSTLGHRSIKIHTSHDDLEFKTFDKEAELNLIDMIEEGRKLASTSLITNEKVNSDDGFSRLKSLTKLKDEGLITDAEFIEKKKSILDSL
ncbi:PH domain-containing protein [Rahnella aceris]